MGDRVKDLLDLPEQIRKGDLGREFGEGLEHMDDTAVADKRPSRTSKE